MPERHTASSRQRNRLCRAAGGAPWGETPKAFRGEPHFQIFSGVCIQTATTISQTSVTGMKTFQPNRMIWS